MVAVPQSVSDHARVYSCVLLLSHNAPPPPPHSLLVAGHGLFVARRRDGAVVIRSVSPDSTRSRVMGKGCRRMDGCSKCRISGYLN